MRAKYKSLFGFFCALLFGSVILLSLGRDQLQAENVTSPNLLQSKTLLKMSDTGEGKSLASNLHDDGELQQIKLHSAKEMILTGQNLKQISPSLWHQLLTKDQFYIMWEKGTERAFSGDLLNEKRKGVYVTSGCRLPVFTSEQKYQSGTGWPSFWDVMDESNIVLKQDSSWGMRRIEVLSACGEHLGHVFEDGPAPTGHRYCINSNALAFIPQGKNDPLGPLDLRSDDLANIQQ